ncbi:Protein of unknown function [Gryllus bimaculatus]|nr:Protein of unknown function [Gryllus bimaculatus]
MEGGGAAGAGRTVSQPARRAEGARVPCVTGRRDAARRGVAWCGVGCAEIKVERASGFSGRESLRPLLSEEHEKCASATGDDKGMRKRQLELAAQEGDVCCALSPIPSVQPEVLKPVLREYLKAKEVSNSVNTNFFPKNSIITIHIILL